MYTVAHCQKTRLNRVINDRFWGSSSVKGILASEMYPCDLQRFIVSSGALNLIQQFLK
jgi:hypothetical protein